MHPSFEIWKPVSGFEGRYDVSTFGRVRSLVCNMGKRKTPKMLKLPLTKAGYPKMSLRDGEKTIGKYAHHMVLEAFIGPRTDKHECGHLDNDRSNNAIWNLQWITGQQNNDQQHYDNRRTNRKLTPEQVQEIRFRNECGTPLAQLAPEYGMHKKSLSLVNRGKLYRLVK